MTSNEKYVQFLEIYAQRLREYEHKRSVARNNSEVKNADIHIQLTVECMSTVVEILKNRLEVQDA